jgi:hypothetical protein
MPASRHGRRCKSPNVLWDRGPRQRGNPSGERREGLVWHPCTSGAISGRSERTRAHAPREAAGRPGACAPRAHAPRVEGPGGAPTRPARRCREAFAAAGVSAPHRAHCARSLRPPDPARRCALSARRADARGRRLRATCSALRCARSEARGARPHVRARAPWRRPVRLRPIAACRRDRRRARARGAPHPEASG